ncbi:O-antigen ligase family protein [Thiohalorhabdus sp.]|uniref:O-antigen ligase family protein n=1 Tax=Thiohalorhabdus sp. TaxID=3094134 RepID=UPI002FC2A546
MSPALAHPLPFRDWRSVAGPALLAVAFAVSLFFNGKHIPFLAMDVGLLVAFAALALGPGIRNGWQVPRSAPAAFLVAFWAFLGASLAWSTVVFTSSLYYWWLAALPLTFFGLLLAPRPVIWVRWGALGLGILLLGLAVWALVQFFVLTGTYGFRAKHPLLNPNNLAGLFNLALVPCLAVYFAIRERRAAILALAGALLLFAGLVATQSRGGYLALGVALGVMLWVGRGLPGMNRRRVGAALIGALAIFILMNTWSGGGVGRRIETLGAMGAQSSFQTRLVIWDSTLDMALERPLTGYGLGTFFLYYPRFRQPADGSGGYYAHMDPLQLWVEIGIGGPVLFYLFLLAVLVRTSAAVRELDPADRERLAVIGPFGGMLTVAVHTHITFHLYILPILIGLGVVLAAWHLATERALDKPRRRIALPEKANPRVWQGILGGLVALVVLHMGAAAASDRFIKWGKEAIGKGNVATALDYFHYARALTPKSDTPYALGAEIRQRALAGAAQGLSAEERGALYREGHWLLDKAQARNPARARFAHLRARLFLVAPDRPLASRLAAAERAWQNALAKDPRLLTARLSLANLYRRQDRRERALKTLEAGLKWPHPGTRPVPLYLRTAAQRSSLGNRDAAVAAARSALQRLPEASQTAQAVRRQYGLQEASDGTP